MVIMMGMFGVSHGIKNVIREMIRQQVEAKQKLVLKYLSVRFSTVRQSRLHMDSEIQINAQPQWAVLHAAHVSGFGPWAASCAPWQCVCSCGAFPIYHRLLPCLWGVVCVGFWFDFAWLL